MGQHYSLRSQTKSVTRHPMKHLFLACLFPALLTAQTMHLTEQLGKTVLYGDIAISPDGKNLAWVQSTAATTSKQTYIRTASGDASATVVDIGNDGERKDADPAWSPDSKTLAFFSNAGEKNADQKQLWTANGDGSGAKKLTQLAGYAARPRWSHDGKPIAFIEGLMSDEGFHGGNLVIMPTDDDKPANHASGVRARLTMQVERKTSVSSLFWVAPDRIVFTEYVGGGGAISELAFGNKPVREIWKGEES